MLCCRSPSDPLAFASALGLQSKGWVGRDRRWGDLGGVPGLVGLLGSWWGWEGAEHPQDTVPSFLLGGLKEGVLGAKLCLGRGEIPVTVPG